MGWPHAAASTDGVWVQALAALRGAADPDSARRPRRKSQAGPAPPCVMHTVPLNGDAYGSYHAVSNLFSAFSGVMIGWIGLGTLAI